MTNAPDLLDITLSAIAKRVPLTPDQIQRTDMEVRHEIGGTRDGYVRKKSVYLRDVILARYDGRTETLRMLCKEYEISEMTVRRIARGRIAKGPATPPVPSPRLSGKSGPATKK